MKQFPGRDLDLILIWNKQDLPDPVKDALDRISEEVFFKISLQGNEIDTASLDTFMYRLHKEEPGASKSTYGNYLALTREAGVHEFTRDFHGMGTLKLRVLVDPDEKLDRKILIVRKAGMKLFRLGNISKLISFTGILQLCGKNLNSYFRSMETVAHDNWEPGRHKDPKQAKAFYEEIKDWIRETIASLAEYSSSDETDVKGLSGVLQQEDDSSEKKREGDAAKEGLC